MSALVTARLRAGRAWLFDVGRVITRTRSTVSRTSGFAARAILRAQLEQAQSLRSTLSYLASRVEQLRIARLTDRQQVDLLLARQREHMRRVREIAAAALRSIADRLRRDGNREGGQLMDRAGAGAAAGRLDVLQVAGVPLGTAPQTSGPDLQSPAPGVTPPVTPGDPAPTTVGTPVPAPTPLPLPTLPPTPVPKPDLAVPSVVALVTYPNPLGCEVRYRRGNDGTVAAGESTTTVQLASPGLPTLTSTIAAVPLDPGQSQQEQILFPGINCDPDVYQVTATVTADSANVVDESSETNNSTTRAFGPPIAP